MRVTTPVAGFTGTVVGVRFDGGEGQTDDAAALAYFSRHGYGIGDVAPESEAPPLSAGPSAGEGTDGTEEDPSGAGASAGSAVAAELERPAGNAPKQAWIDFAIASGKTEAQIEGLTQPQIRALFDE